MPAGASQVPAPVLFSLHLETTSCHGFDPCTRSPARPRHGLSRMPAVMSATCPCGSFSTVTVSGDSQVCFPIRAHVLLRCDGLDEAPGQSRGRSVCRIHRGQHSTRSIRGPSSRPPARSPRAPSCGAAQQAPGEGPLILGVERGPSPLRNNGDVGAVSSCPPSGLPSLGRSWIAGTAPE